MKTWFCWHCLGLAKMKLLGALSLLVILLIINVQADELEDTQDFSQDADVPDMVEDDVDDVEMDAELTEERNGDARPGKNCAGCTRCYRCKFQTGPRTCHKFERRVCPKCTRNRCYDNMKPPTTRRRRAGRRRRWTW